jgi:hypothetical protein
MPEPARWSQGGPYIDVVFDGPPGPEAGRFVELENERGESISVGYWVPPKAQAEHYPAQPPRDDKLWRLRIHTDVAAWVSAASHEAKEPIHDPAQLAGRFRELYLLVEHYRSAEARGREGRDAAENLWNTARRRVSTLESDLADCQRSNREHGMLSVRGRQPTAEERLEWLRVVGERPCQLTVEQLTVELAPTPAAIELHPSLAAELKPVSLESDDVLAARVLLQAIPGESLADAARRVTQQLAIARIDLEDAEREALATAAAVGVRLADADVGGEG